MAISFEHIRDILLDELRAKGYAPNPSDVVGAVKAIMEKVESHVEDVLAEFRAAEALVKPASDEANAPAIPGSTPLPATPPPVPTPTSPSIPTPQGAPTPPTT